MNGLPVSASCKGKGARIYTAFTATGDERVVGVLRSASAAKKAFKRQFGKDSRAKGPFCQRPPEEGESFVPGSRYAHGARFLKTFNRIGFVVGIIAFGWFVQNKGLEEALKKLSPAGAKLAERAGGAT